MRKKPGARSDINKLAIRRDYAQGLTNVSELARKHGVHRDTIAKWIKAESWGSAQEIADEVSAEIRQQAVAQVAESLVPAIAKELACQGRIAAKLAEAAEKTVDDFLANKIHPSEKQNKADVLNALANAVAKAFDAGREINGIAKGQPSVGESQDGGGIQIQFVVPKAS